MKRLTCSCGCVLGYESRHAGKRVKCSGCGKALTVPAEDDEDDQPMAMQSEDEEEPIPRSKPRKQAKEYEEERPRRRREVEEPEEEADEEEEERPRRKKQKGPLTGVANWLVDHNYLSILLAIAAVACIATAVIQGMLTSGSSSTPQRLTLTDLAKNGPGNNLNVIVSGATPAERIVIQKKGTTTEAFFVPLLLPGAARDATSFPAILIVYENSEAKLNEVLARQEYQGTVVNSVIGLGTTTENLLKQNYPGTDFSKVHLIQSGREPWSPALIMTLWVLGVIAALLAVAMWGVMWFYSTG